MNAVEIAEVIRQELERRQTTPFRAAINAGMPENAIRYVLEGREPKAGRLAKICEALDLELYIGRPRGEPTPALDRFSPSVEMPVRGWARCSIEGYLESEKKFHDLPMPMGLEDEDAFYAMALGASMRSEGVENGDYCVVSPNTPLTPGRRVWLKNQRDQVTIKRLLSETETRYHLLGWQDPDEKGNQAPYHDQWLKSYVKAKGAVLEVYRGRPSVKNPPLLIADPRPPPGLPKGARTLEAAGALGQRFSDEALRDELVSALREETKALRTATETALKELVSRLPPAAQNLEDDTAQRSPAGGKVLPFVPATESVDDDDFDSVRRYDADEVRLAAGGLGFVDREPLAGEVKFRRDWLGSHRLEAKNLMLLDVIGDSMLPTIEERDSVLIDESRRKPRSGRIYGLRTTDGPLVKRLRKRGGRWWADSDNDKYEPRLMSEEDQTLGRVVWWAHTEE